MARNRSEQNPRGVMEVEWPFFGELCRGLALKVWRDYEPDLVVGIAKAGVIPGAVISAILRADFASIALTRRRMGDPPALVSRPTLSPSGRLVLLVDETCDSGDTMRLAASVMTEEGAQEVRTAVSFRTAAYRPDYWALQTPDFIVLPWDRWVIENGELVVRPDYADALRATGLDGAAAHQRTDVPTDGGTGAPAHGGTDAPAHRRTGAPTSGRPATDAKAKPAPKAKGKKR
jgi:hypoxanthine phosphoribosyltransferase